MDSNQKGILAVLKVQMRAWEKGVDLYAPINPASRCDMIVDWCGKLYRAQIKYAGGLSAKSRGIAIVNLTKGEHGERRYTADEIDVLLTYVPQLDKICWFGPEVFDGKTKLHIRLEPPINCQKKGCLLIEDYIW